MVFFSPLNHPRSLRISKICVDATDYKILILKTHARENFIVPVRKRNVSTPRALVFFSFNSGIIGSNLSRANARAKIPIHSAGFSLRARRTKSWRFTKREQKRRIVYVKFLFKTTTNTIVFRPLQLFASSSSFYLCIFHSRSPFSGCHLIGSGQQPFGNCIYTHTHTRARLSQ